MSAQSKMTIWSVRGIVKKIAGMGIGVKERITFGGKQRKSDECFDELLGDPGTFPGRHAACRKRDLASLLFAHGGDVGGAERCDYFRHADGWHRLIHRIRAAQRFLFSGKIDFVFEQAANFGKGVGENVARETIIVEF